MKYPDFKEIEITRVICLPLVSSSLFEMKDLVQDHKTYISKCLDFPFQLVHISNEPQSLFS
jgi:uncharacterized protein YqhQ